MKRMAQMVSRDIGLFLEQNGFYEDADLRFIREQDECYQIIGFALRTASSRIHFVTIGVRVHFPEVEEIKNPERNEKWWGTYGGLIHILEEQEPQRYREWPLTDSGLTREHEVFIIRLLEETAFPFLEKFCSLDAVRRVLESDKPKNWLGDGPEGRILTLAAIYWVQDFQERAMSMLEEAAAGARLMMYRYRYDDLLTTMRNRVKTLPPVQGQEE